MRSEAALAVGDLNREGVGAVEVGIRRVIISTVGIDRDRTVGRRSGIGIKGERQVVAVDIRRRHRTTDQRVFKAVATGRTGDRRAVVGAGDGNRRRARCRATLAVRDGVVECHIAALADAQILEASTRIKRERAIGVVGYRSFGRLIDRIGQGVAISISTGERKRLRKTIFSRAACNGRGGRRGVRCFYGT